jgi:hypothetical protein
MRPIGHHRLTGRLFRLILGLTAASKKSRRGSSNGIGAIFMASLSGLVADHILQIREHPPRSAVRFWLRLAVAHDLEWPQYLHFLGGYIHGILPLSDLPHSVQTIWSTRRAATIHRHMIHIEIAPATIPESKLLLVRYDNPM